jgi:hypothetical protein
MQGNVVSTGVKLLGLAVVLILSGCAGHYGGSHYGYEKILKQETVFSVQDPIPGHSAHQLALLLPPEDGVIYSGSLTYTASKPVEVVVLHEYAPDHEPDSAHDVLLIGEVGGKRYAISVMQFPNAVPITNSATISFTGSALALHTLNGEPFTATYSLNVVRYTPSS